METLPAQPPTTEQAPGTELSDQEVFKQTEEGLDAANKASGGNLFVKIGSKQPDGSVVDARFFDAANKNGVYLIEVSGQGFKVIESPEDPTGGISAAIVAQRKWLETGQKPMYVGDVMPGHTKLTDGTEEFILPHGNSASSKEGSKIKYRSATQEDIEALLPLNATAAEQINIQRVKEEQERLKKEPANVVRSVLSKLSTLLRRSPTAQAPMPISPPAPLPTVA